MGWLKNGSNASCGPVLRFLFGAPRLVRFLTISGKEFLPSQGIARPIEPELIVLDQFLKTLQISHEQLVDLALLVGTDFNSGVKGIGPKKALKLVRAHGRIESMPDDIRQAVGDVDAVRHIYLAPPVTDEYDIRFEEPDVDGVVQFLCGEREFSRDRIMAALDRAFRQRSFEA